MRPILDDVVLTGYAASTAFQRVQAALAFEGIDYEDRTNTGSVGYAARVPRLSGRLEQDPIRVSQSLAILSFLEEVRPSPSLLPSSISARAGARELLSIMV